MSVSRPPEQQPQRIGETISEISERASVLVREEIELAKAELTEKVTSLLRGAVVGIAAGIFLVTALLFFLIGCAWLLYFYLPGATFAYFWGFFGMAVILVLMGVFAGFTASRVVKKGAPPVPSMAIEEARKIRETVSPADGAGAADAAALAGAPDAAAQGGAPDAAAQGGATDAGAQAGGGAGA
jgi:uncharacterized membrane protein YqjE